MLRTPLLLFLAAAAAILPAQAQASSVLFASGRWAAIDRGGQCEAATRGLRTASKGRPQAIAGFAFDARGPRNGQFFARLSRVPRAGSSVMLTVGSQPFMLVSKGNWAWSRGSAQDTAIIAAARAAGGMRIEGRDAASRRFVDYYLLDGAATAIDAAAAGCAANAGKTRPA